MACVCLCAGEVDVREACWREKEWGVELEIEAPSSREMIGRPFASCS